MYDIKFLTDTNYAEFGKMLGGLLRFISPFLMIGVSIILAGWLISLIIATIRKAVGRDNEEYQRDTDVKDSNRDEYKQKYKY